jgi:hypothetical protein
MKSTKQIKLIMMLTFTLMPTIFSTFDIIVKFPDVWVVKLSAVDSKGIVSANYRYVFDSVSVNDKDANITLNYYRSGEKGVIRKLYLGQYQLYLFKLKFVKQGDSNEYRPMDHMKFTISADTAGATQEDVIKEECHFYTEEGKHYMEFTEKEVARIHFGFTQGQDF